MTTTQLGPVDLCALAHDLLGVIQHYQHQNTALKMCNTLMGEWDEIRVMAVDAGAGKEKLILKISLAQLTTEERSQLQLQISLHNQALLNSNTV